jgi:hypothetical protein
MSNAARTTHKFRENVQIPVTQVAEFELFFTRLRDAIGTDDLYGWGKAHGFARQTLYNMVSGSKVPGLEILRKFREETGKPIGWLLGEEGALGQPGSSTGSGNNDFIFVPRYKHDATDPDGAVAFRRHWIEKYLNVSPDHLTVYRIEDDAMLGTFSPSDNVLINGAPVSTVRDGLYALLINGAMVIRRVQTLPNNVVRVMPDNSRYPSFDVELGEGCGVDVVGVPVWYSRMI